MKRRITLTIDPEMVRRAKRIAHERNTSVSALMEEFVRSAALASEKERPSFVRKWAGQFSVRSAAKPEPRLEALKTRYGLDRE